MSTVALAETLERAVRGTRLSTLTVRQLAFLAHMAAGATNGRTEPWGTTELAQEFGLGKAAVTRAVQKMQSQGLVVNGVSWKDKRKRRIRPTEEGIVAIIEALGLASADQQAA